MKSRLLLGTLLLLETFASSSLLSARDISVAVTGNDRNDGSPGAPFKTISAAAQVAQPGDVITVHAGIYRERVNPPRGGASDTRRIVYRAAPGERVEIRGSEIVRNWEKVRNDVWKVTLPNSYFGKFNPYSDVIHGDWYGGNGRTNHTGSVYQNGDWLNEAAKQDDLWKPNSPGTGYLLNLASIQVGHGRAVVPTLPADRFASVDGPKTAPDSEGGQCLGFIHNGNSATYENVDFGLDADTLRFRAASPVDAVIEIHADSPDGKLLGSCPITATGDWQKYATFQAPIQPTSGIKTLCLVFRASPETQQWFAQVDAKNTTIWAQFNGANPNQQNVEINVRQSVFYPEKTGINYITVRGFIMRNAATPWAPPTAEQIGLIGTHWSKGWIIENNDIAYSMCTGITLGKYGDEWDNKSESADAYNRTIQRALKNGWSKDLIGHHIVRNNTISHCEQAGIVGSLGAVFCTISGNTIHDIHVRNNFNGPEMAGIKFHAAIDTVITGNFIYHTYRALFMDWMAQGTQITGNLLQDSASQDLYVEVSHGPLLVANNIFLSGQSIIDYGSNGDSYAHNLIAGAVAPELYQDRQTPYMKEHSTEVAGLHDNTVADNRFYNNIFVGAGNLSGYDKATKPVWFDGNVFFKGTTPSTKEKDPLLVPSDPHVKLVQQGNTWDLEMTLPPNWTGDIMRPLVTSQLLGKVTIPNVNFENPDGTPVRLDTDYFGKPRNLSNPTPGPFENPGEGDLKLQVWPKPPTR